MDPQKPTFLNGLIYVASVFLYQYTFKRQAFSQSLGVPHPQGPPKFTPKKQSFKLLKLGCQCFFAISGYLTDKYVGVAWGYLPSGVARGGPPRVSPFWGDTIL